MISTSSHTHHHPSCRLSSFLALTLIVQSRPSFWVVAVVEVKCIYSTLVQARREKSTADYPPSSIPSFLLGHFLLPGNLPFLESLSLSRDIDHHHRQKH